MKRGRDGGRDVPDERGDRDGRFRLRCDVDEDSSVSTA